MCYIHHFLPSPPSPPGLNYWHCLSGHHKSLLTSLLACTHAPSKASRVISHQKQHQIMPSPATWETWVQSLGWEDPLEKQMATHSSILAWKIPWMEEPGRLQSMGSQRVRHDRAASLHQKINSMRSGTQLSYSPLHFQCLQQCLSQRRHSVSIACLHM